MSLETRFWARVDRRAANECWPWTGPLDRGGYGTVFLRKGPNRVNVYNKAHRVSWELQRGSIPQGLHIDHLCRVRHCVNPAHLEPVTPAENARRGALRRRADYDTHCPGGHVRTDGNTYVDAKNVRHCRECWVVSNRAAYLRRRAAARQPVSS